MNATSTFNYSAWDYAEDHEYVIISLHTNWILLRILFKNILFACITFSYPDQASQVPGNANPVSCLFAQCFRHVGFSVWGRLPRGEKFPAVKSSRCKVFIYECNSCFLQLIHAYACSLVTQELSIQHPQRHRGNMTNLSNQERKEMSRHEFVFGCVDSMVIYFSFENGCVCENACAPICVK
jgi:hypothetical protein